MTATLPCWLAVAALIWVATLLGGEVLLLAGPGRPHRRPPLVPALAAGLLAVHLLLWLLAALGVAWTPLSTGLALAAAALGGWGLRRRLLGPMEARASLPRPGWGELVAGLAVAGFAAAALGLRATHPDFVYHWGLKAKRFWLAGGIDWAFLGRPWNHYTHPDYPTLLPELYALSATLAGRFEEAPLMLFSVLFVALLLVAARRLLVAAGVAGWLRQAGLAALGLGVAAFGVGYLQAGGADLMIALAAVAGLRALLSGLEEGEDLPLGVAAAFAAAAKIEGVILGGWLIGGYVLRLARRRAVEPRRLLRVVLPWVLVVGLWAGANLHHGLFQATNTGSLELDHLPTIGAGLVVAASRPQWHGLPALLLLLPALLLLRRSRPAALLVLAQGGFYLLVYLTSPLDVDFYVRSSAPRLLLHLLPVTWLGALLALDDAGPAEATGAVATPRARRR